MEDLETKGEETCDPAASSGTSGADGGGAEPYPLPQPLEGLHDVRLPPFLTKVSEMVEDPSSDSLISWSSARNSFIVWDQFQFATDVLPRYFKHRNFTSFVRQLNQYGFKKICPDRYEFANGRFLGGQKYLLKTIKSQRKTSAAPSKIQQGANPCVESQHDEKKEEIETLKRDRDQLVLEVEQLKQQQQSSTLKFVAIGERIRATEARQKQLVSFIVMVFRNFEFLQQYEDKNLQSNDQSHVEIGRKRKLDLSPEEETLQNVAPVVANGGQLPNCTSLEQEELVDVQIEMEAMFSAALDDISNVNTSESLPVAPTSDNRLNPITFTEMNTWEELLGGDLTGFDQVREVMNADQTEDVGLEDFAAETGDWGEALKHLAQQLDIL